MPGQGRLGSGQVACTPFAQNLHTWWTVFPAREAERFTACCDRPRRKRLVRRPALAWSLTAAVPSGSAVLLGCPRRGCVPPAEYPEVMEASHELIWQIGKPWRELTDDLSHGVHTVVTSTLAAYVIDMTAGFYTRLRGGHPMLLDGERLRLDGVGFANPCGIYLIGGTPGTWHASTPLLFVAVGAVPNWTALEGWPSIRDAAVARDWNLDGHPAERCRALHCLLDQPLDN